MRAFTTLGNFITLGGGVLWLIALWRLATAVNGINEKWMLVFAFTLSFIGQLIITICRHKGQD